MTELVVTTPEALSTLLRDVLSDFQAKQGESPQQDWMTTQEAQEYIRVSHATIYKLVAEKRIPYSTIGRSKRFSRRELDRWLLDSV